jgi:hypothetical protein
MDPIETWHDAPDFERMEKRISDLEFVLKAIRGMTAGASDTIYYISNKVLERK